MLTFFFKKKYFKDLSQEAEQQKQQQILTSDQTKQEAKESAHDDLDLEDKEIQPNLRGSEGLFNQMWQGANQVGPMCCTVYCVCACVFLHPHPSFILDASEWRSK